MMIGGRLKLGRVVIALERPAGNVPSADPTSGKLCGDRRWACKFVDLEDKRLSTKQWRGLAVQSFSFVAPRSWAARISARCYS
jgi:hypothetical protein